MMKKPEEIKKGLECCINEEDCPSECPYFKNCSGDGFELERDALAYIQQLEAQNATIMQSFQRLKKVCVEQGQTIQQLEAERDAAVSELVGTCQVQRYADQHDQAL